MSPSADHAALADAGVRPDGHIPGTPPPTGADIEAVVDRMARREVAAHFLVPSDQPPGVIRPPAPPVSVRVVRCPWCGGGPDDPGFTDLAVPFAHWPVSAAETAPVDGDELPRLTMLGCEWLAPRAVLPMAVAIERYGPQLARAFQTRAAARAALAPTTDPLAALCALDQAETWADAVTADADAASFAAAATATLPGGLVLPAATRRLADEAGWTAVRAVLEPLFAGPHFPVGPDAQLAVRYFATRLRHAGAALDGEVPCPA